MKVKIIDLSGKVISEKEVKLSIKKSNTQAIFDQVIAENAGKRQGTHSTLTKGEVRGGGKKPWQQKHTGNARQGSIRNPHWVGGGVVFGPKPVRNYKLKVNSKVSNLAYLSALNVKLTDGAIFVLHHDGSLKKPDTKKIITLYEKLAMVGKKVLVIVDGFGKESKSFNNIPKTSIKFPQQVSVKDILNNKLIVVFEKAFDQFIKVGG